MKLVLNGILLAAFVLAVGLAYKDAIAIMFAFAMAGFAYITNMLEDLGREEDQFTFFQITFIAGFLGVLWAIFIPVMYAG
jgi:hypothetical protein